MLSSKEIAAMKPRSKRYQITDEKGLALRVQSSGVKSWVLRVPQNGRVIDISLGHWPEISLMQARALARKKKKELELEPPKSFTVKDAFKFWCSKKIPEYSRSNLFLAYSTRQLRHCLQRISCNCFRRCSRKQ